jgi:hypothetical protein
MLTELNITQSVLDSEVKKKWHQGAWKWEPDFRSWDLKEIDVSCVIKRMPSMGNLCGYVGVKSNHSFYQKPLEIVKKQINERYGKIEINLHCACFINQIMIDPNLYWIGFHYPHSDGYPGCYWKNFIPPVYVNMNKMVNDTNNLALIISGCKNLTMN